MKKEAVKFQDSELFEGKVSLRALLDAPATLHNDRKIEVVYFAKEKLASEARFFSFLSKKAKELDFSIELCPRAELENMAIGNTHGGVIARCTKRTLLPFSDSVLQNNPRGFFVYLDGVEDPYNFGYALRSLYAAGVDGMIVGARNWMGAAGVVCRASAGASERCPIYLCENTEEMAKRFTDNGYRILCADIGNSISVYDADLTLPLLLVVGGEKRGIHTSLLQKADSIIRLEYGRPFSAALSTASAATLLAYEVYRKNRFS